MVFRGYLQFESLDCLQGEPHIGLPSMFNPFLPQFQLSNGRSLWQGTFQSVRPGWKLQINVDVANKPGYDAGIYLLFS